MAQGPMEDDVMLEGLEDRTFTTKMRGYDPDEVRALLSVVARALRDQKKQAETAYQAVGEEMGEMLQQARDRADAMIADAEQRAADLVAQANAIAEEKRGAAQAEATATRAAADHDAARARAEAEQAAAHIERLANDEAARVAADAARAAEELRSQAQRDADERTARADERVRALESEENEARERIHEVAAELLAVSQRLQELEPTHTLGWDGPDHAAPPVAAEINREALAHGSSDPAS